MTDKRQLFKQLEEAKINRNDVVLMHSSMKKIGEFDGGVEGLIKAFTEYLTDGLFVLPTHTWHVVNKDQPIFDVKNTMPCTGIIPLTAVKMGGVRSLNPTHSVAVFGKTALEFVEGESEIDTPTPKKGCYGKLYDKNGVILLAGVNHNKNTYIHCIEETAELPNRLTKDYTTFYVVDRNGIKRERKMKEIFCPYHEDVSHEFMKLKGVIERSGAETPCRIGNADSFCCRVRPLTDALLKIMKEEKAKDRDYLIDELYREYKKRNF